VADAAVPELPFVSDVLELAEKDLDASNSLVQRLLAIGDGLLATTLTIASLFIGLAFSSHHPAIVLAPTPLALALGYLDGLNWVHFRQASGRVRQLEYLFQAYIRALRETGAARPDAIDLLRHQVDGYHFGTEGSLVSVSVTDIWLDNRTRLRWYIYLVVAAVMVLSAALCN
jgi:hypothetical protein